MEVWASTKWRPNFHSQLAPGGICISQFGFGVNFGSVLIISNWVIFRSYRRLTSMPAY
jgi:hypothetical protein